MSEFNELFSTFFGLLKDEKDLNDIPYKIKDGIPKLPNENKYPLDFAPKAINQGQTSTCSAQSLKAVFQYYNNRVNKEEIKFSALFAYWNARHYYQYNDTVDSGVSLRNILKSARRFGICEEKFWEFDTEIIFKCPSKEAYLDGKNHQLYSYRTCENKLENILHATLQGQPVLIGIPVYKEAFFGKDGIVNLPEKDDKFLAYHAMPCFGYEKIFGKSYFCCLNSHGTNYGRFHGLAYVNFDYIDLMESSWAVQLLEDISPEFLKEKYERGE